MPRQHSRQNRSTHASNTDDMALDPRLKLATRALTVGTTLAPIVLRLWRWRAAIRIGVSVAMLAVPVMLRIRALRSATAREHDPMPAPYRLPRPIVWDDTAHDAEASELPARGS